MIKMNPNLYPDGGRYFLDEDGTKFKAENWDFLARRVANYRRRAGKPAGDPEAEIMAQACARQPNLCAEENVGPSPPPSQPIVVRENAGNLTKRVTKWLSVVLTQFRGSKLAKVDRSEAKRRAEICKHCPLQRALSEVCGSCKRTRKGVVESILRSERRVNEELKGCLALGEDTSLSVHLSLPATGDGSLPGHCWRR